MTALAKPKKPTQPVKRAAVNDNINKSTLTETEKARIDHIQKKYKHLIDALPLD
jgi:hypothetical protein